jgi:hypothetical protein
MTDAIKPTKSLPWTTLLPNCFWVFVNNGNVYQSLPFHTSLFEDCFVNNHSSHLLLKIIINPAGHEIKLTLMITQAKELLMSS